jgi:hypothetical protein
VGGVVTWAIGYGAGLVYAASQKFENGSGWAVVPIVGPWGAIGAREFGCDTSSVTVSRSDVDDCVNGALGEVEAITLLAVDGLFQTMGATLFIIGLSSSEKQWIRTDVAGVTFVPTLTLREGPGLQLHGLF